MENLKAIDFFCSIGGVTSGFRKAGIDVLAGIDIDNSCKETYEINNPGTKFIHADIKDYKFHELELETGISKNDDELIFIGCSPCQFWTKIQTDKTKSLLTKNLLLDFLKFVVHFKPGYVLVENVPGILTKSEESGLDDFIKQLEELNYIIDYDVLNAANLGIPQSRKRFTLVASRLKKIKLNDLEKTEIKTVRDILGPDNGFSRIPAGTKDGSKFMHTCAGLSQKNIERLKRTKPGGNRISWKDIPELQLNCYKGKDDQFLDNYGRIEWDKPAPTVTTKFYSISNGRFAHPEENRGISLREGAALQTFPHTYQFKADSIANIAKHIGNAVPPLFAEKIANLIIGVKSEY